MTRLTRQERVCPYCHLFVAYEARADRHLDLCRREAKERVFGTATPAKVIGGNRQMRHERAEPVTDEEDE